MKKAKEAAGKSKGKGKKGPKGAPAKTDKDAWGGFKFPEDKGKGKGKHAKTARASALRSTNDFPDGGAGLDSWANVYLQHVKSDEFTGNQSLKLASGECKCEVSEGKKGVPQAKVVHIDGKENIDLLPLGWLWSRGCNYGWGIEGPTLHTPHGNPIPVLMWGRLPYITPEAVVKLFDDLPETNEPAVTLTEPYRMPVVQGSQKLASPPGNH